MIEAVDWREYDRFFERCRALVGADGLVVLQAITVPDESFDRVKRGTDFIKAAIFPGGCLPSVAALSDAAARHGLTPHAAATRSAPTTPRPSAAGAANLDAARPELAALGYDERFARQWDFYFSYCEAGFEERYVGDSQLLFVAPDRAALRPHRVQQAAARRPGQRLIPEHPMPHVRAAVRSPWSAVHAFEYLADLEHFAEWDPGTVKSERIPATRPGAPPEWDVTVRTLRPRADPALPDRPVRSPAPPQGDRGDDGAAARRRHHGRARRRRLHRHLRRHAHPPRPAPPPRPAVRARLPAHGRPGRGRPHRRCSRDVPA